MIANHFATLRRKDFRKTNLRTAVRIASTTLMFSQQSAWKAKISG